MEVLLAVALLGALLTLALTALRPARSGVQSEAVAQSLAAEFRAVRAQALATHTPQALALHLQGGHGAAVAYRLLGGHNRPRELRQVDLTSEFPGAALTLPTEAGASLTRPLAHPRDGSFDLAGWLAGLAGEAVFVFTPWGTVLSNDLPLEDGSYRIVVSQGVELVAAADPGGGAVPALAPARHRPAKLCHPQQVVISPAGQVRVEPYSGPAALTEAPLPLPAPAPRAAADNSNQAPRVRAVSFLPTAPPTLPAGIDSVVSRDQQVSLQVEALDPDGETLYCEWKSDGAKGLLSAPGRTRMEYDGTQWVSTWSFHPAPTDAGGTPYRLSCQVTDERGQDGVAEAGVALTLDLKLVDTRKFVFMSDEGGFKIRSANDDGSESIVLYDGAGARWPRLSPDGTKVAFQAASNLYVVNPDGTGLKLLTSSGSRNETPHWSEDGSRIFFFSDRDGTLNLWEVDAGGEAETGPARKLTDLSVLPAGVVDGQFTITPDGKKAVVMVNGDLYRYDLPTHAVQPLETDPSFFAHWPRINPAQPDVLMYHQVEGGNPTVAVEGPLYTMPLAGGAGTMITVATSENWHGTNQADWSYDGSRVVFNFYSFATGDVQLARCAADGSNYELVVRSGRPFDPSW